MRIAPTDSKIWMCGSQLLNCLKKLGRFGLVGGGISLEVSKAHARPSVSLSIFLLPCIRMQSSQPLLEYHACVLPARDQWDPVSTDISITQLLHLWLREYLRRANRKTVRDKIPRSLWWNSLSYKWLHKKIAIMTISVDILMWKEENLMESHSRQRTTNN